MEPVPLPCSLETQISAATSDSTMRRKANSWETFSISCYKSLEIKNCSTQTASLKKCPLPLYIFLYLYIYIHLYTLYFNALLSTSLSLLSTSLILSLYFHFQLNFSARVHRCSGRLHVVVGRRRHRDPRTSRLHPPRPTPRRRLPWVGCWHWHSYDIALSRIPYDWNITGGYLVGSRCWLYVSGSETVFLYKEYSFGNCLGINPSMARSILRISVGGISWDYNSYLVCYITSFVDCDH